MSWPGARALISVMSASSSHTEREGFLYLAFVTTPEPRGTWRGNEGTPFLPPNICHNRSGLTLAQNAYILYENRACLFILSWWFSITPSSCDPATSLQQCSSDLLLPPNVDMCNDICDLHIQAMFWWQRLIRKKNLLKVLRKSQSHCCSIMQGVWLQNTCNGVAERFLEWTIGSE